VALPLTVFQSILGCVYYVVGLLSALFMFGLFLGSQSRSQFIAPSLADTELLVDETRFRI